MQSSPGSGLHNGTFTIFSSDHCPFRYGDDVHGKASGIFEADESLQAPTDDSEALQQVMQKEKGKFRFVPNGIPGVETRLPLLYTGGLQTGRISPQRFVEVTSTNPAKLVSCTIRNIFRAVLIRAVWLVPSQRSDHARIRRRLYHCESSHRR